MDVAGEISSHGPDNLAKTGNPLKIDCKLRKIKEKYIFFTIWTGLEIDEINLSSRIEAFADNRFYYNIFDRFHTLTCARAAAHVDE